MNVSLTPELEALVHRKVASGRYNSASEVIREALRLVEEKEWIRERRLEELRREIMKGEEDMKAGRYVTIETDEDAKKLAENIKREGRRRFEEGKAKDLTNAMS